MSKVFRSNILFILTVYYKMQYSITKTDGYFVTKCDRSLLQIASGFSLQNATVLLQNATVFTKCDVYYKLRL